MFGFVANCWVSAYESAYFRGKRSGLAVPVLPDKSEKGKHAILKLKLAISRKGKGRFTLVK